ncbi:hypothetical protein QBC44DRAFT_403592 [Cladorrhinum sp. PSN332]|nr:hypothetical protein QBC44DRAFT_403592 [Cladorrhinum sp. PSN332]
MCFQEFIAYQCGHRSLAVIRACPLTTASPNLPLCAIQPVKQYFAETMCAPCEREIHTRWVLIREWEHHWLHDRGACSCEVQFPGPSYPPRTVGPLDNINTQSEGNGKGKQKESQFPPAFQEWTGPDGERHVQVRVPGQYAVEWRADHPQLHKEGRCHCSAQFGSAVPRIPDQDIDPASRNTLNAWRRMEDSQAGYPPATGYIPYAGLQLRNTSGNAMNFQGYGYQAYPQTLQEAPHQYQVVLEAYHDPHNAAHRARQATRALQQALRTHRQAFQALQTAPETPERTNKQTRDAYITPPNKYTYPDTICPAPKNTPETTEDPAGPSTHHGLHGSDRASEASQRAFHSAQQAHQDYREAWQSSLASHQASQASSPPEYTEQPPIIAGDPSIMAAGRSYPAGPPPPYTVFPGAPEPATTRSDNIPRGAHPWARSAEVARSVPYVSAGPGPYRTPGLDYSFPSGQGVHPNTVPGHGHAQQHASDSHQHASGPLPQTTAITTGLPVGAGPEGLESHMPSWRNCNLRIPFTLPPSPPHTSIGPYTTSFGHATLFNPFTSREEEEEEEDIYEADDERGGGYSSA